MTSSSPQILGTQIMGIDDKEPDYANARGMWRFAKYLFKQDEPIVEAAPTTKRSSVSASACRINY